MSSIEIIILFISLFEHVVRHYLYVNILSSWEEVLVLTVLPVLARWALPAVVTLPVLVPPTRAALAQHPPSPPVNMLQRVTELLQR